MNKQVVDMAKPISETSNIGSTEPELEVTQEQKETCAILAMRMMLEDYSARTEIPFEKAFESFAISPVYGQLFNFHTHLWAESPDYLCSLFEQYLQKDTANPTE